ncbi:MAG: peptidylprolyl isomerase [Alphaproteobacteria bacterium]
MRRVLSLALLGLLAACTDNRPNVLLETDLGTIEIEVRLDKSPLSGADFLYYVDEKLYDGQAFYRTVISDNDPLNMGMSLIQGGRLDLQPITMLLPHEPTGITGLSNVSGSVTIARDAPGTGSAAFFFINIGDNLFLDQGGTRNPDGEGYAVFGNVVDGMDVAKAIQARATGGTVASPIPDNQLISEPVYIRKAYRK